MRVILHASVFAETGAKDPLLLMALFRLCDNERRHVLVTSPPYDEDDTDSELAHWLGSLSSSMAHRCRDILKRGLLANAMLSKDVASVHVLSQSANNATSDWGRARIGVADAEALLGRPLTLLLENRRNDFDFLLRMAPPTRRAELREAEQHGWVNTVGGGMGEMKRFLQELVTAPPDEKAAWIRKLRLWVMFDRDAHPKDRSQASEQSEEIRALCTHKALNGPWPLGFHQLGRRAIENYLPIEVLRDWQERSRGNMRRPRRELVDALAELGKRDASARWQYNMKKGLLGDLRRATRQHIRQRARDIEDHELDPLFQGLPANTRRALASGLGSDIGGLFQEQTLWQQPGRDEQFQREYDRGPDAPREDVLRTLFDRM